jgi:hypothetical protein
MSEAVKSASAPCVMGQPVGGKPFGFDGERGAGRTGHRERLSVWRRISKGQGEDRNPESWDELDPDQSSMIAPTHFFADGDALLGSVGRRSSDVRYFLNHPEAARDRNYILSFIKQAKSLPDQNITDVGPEILAKMCSIRGMGRSFATRLLTLARPDGFVVVNNKSADWLREASGLKLAGKKRSYRDLLVWLNGQSWRQAPEPTEPTERTTWRIRTALLDAFAYQPRL